MSAAERRDTPGAADADERPKEPPRIRIPRPAGRAGAKAPESEKKHETTRVPLPTEESLKRETEAEPATPYREPPAELEEVLKKSTVRIETPEETAEEAEEQLETVGPEVMEAAKKSTVRVELEEEGVKGDTQKVAGGAPPAEEKKRTARLDLGEVITSKEEEDIFKKRTVELPLEAAPAAAAPQAVPRTIKVKKPTTVPPTAMVKKPAAERHPTEEIKAKTSRIEVPEAATARPTTRKKTIKIKRPGTPTAAAPLTVARPTDVMLGRRTPKEEAELPPVYSLLAAAAVVVSLVLVYVLAAQSILPGLPFPGRLP